MLNNKIPHSEWPIFSSEIKLPESLYEKSISINEKLINNELDYNRFSSNKLKELYSKLSKYNNSDIESRINIERPEQELIVKYLPTECCVLEFGGESGTTSLLINKIIKDPNKHVIIEPSFNSIIKLNKTAEIYNTKYKIVHGFIGKNREIHKKLWPECEISKMYDLKEINKLVDENFDVLVIDCEGAFYNILKEFPEILDNIKLIIIENDGPHENIPYIRETIKKNNFILIHSQTHPFLNTEWNITKINDYKIFKNSNNIIGFHEVYVKI